MKNNKGEVGVIITAVVVVTLIILGLVWLISSNNNRNTTRGRGDAAVGHVNNDPRTIYQMPDRFGNVAMFCDKYGNAVYVTTSDPNRSLWAVKDGCQ